MSKNKLIQRELEKIKVKIESYDEELNCYFIPQVHVINYVKDEVYLFKLDKSLLSASGNEILVINWNQGTFPKYEYIKAKIIKVLGDKIYVGAVYYDFETKKELEEDWMGWLPTNKIQIVEKIV